MAMTTAPTPSSAGQHKLSVQPLISPRGFTFPSLYSFPPFFTQQPNEQTWAHQRAQWITLILAYSRFHKTYRLELTDETCAGELFHNKSINRRLHLATLRNIVEAMVAAGSAEYDPPKPAKGQLPTAALVFWRKPEEWANLIYDWIKESGLTNSIMTFYELTEGGDLVHTTEFYQLSEPILRRALDVLIKAGKAQVFKGLGEDGDGVKFV
ncbi:DUF852 domain-containing protein [Leucosporidium creatinivorum]|uniref:ESCRT-II complex subunit VPS25 n=1 Tax=Leucosporidium creatinivorum TaxID=106004 RepID=A0A1Y2EMH4_9BASI|nr:DUF852 domain-containing protein [Leucosporidium creatinivorum]